MTEPRRAFVVLLDDRHLELVIQPKLFAGELLDMVASHFNLREKEYFGLAYLDDTGHWNWLQLDHRVLDHDLPKKPHQGTLTLHFLVKYFVESIVQLRHSATVEAFYLQAKSHIAKGIIEVDSETVFQLAGLVLQATYGDYVDDQTTKGYLKKLCLIPPSTWKEHPSLSYCEERVVHFHKTVEGQSRGQAIVNYVTIVESLPTYGVHYYKVKDKAGIPWWLGINYKGITQCDQSDKKTPRKVFLWKQLENLLFRDRKFSIEVRDPRRVLHTLSSFNLYEDVIEKPLEHFDPLADAICDPTTQVSVSRRTLGPVNVTVYVWFATTAHLTKCIWSMAVSQHQFYLDHRPEQKPQQSLSQIATELSRSVQSLSSSTSSVSNLSRSASCNSLPILHLEAVANKEAQAAAQEMLSALKARKEALENALKLKNDELQELMSQEEKLLSLRKPVEEEECKEEPRRKVETAFTLSEKVLQIAKSSQEEHLSQLEIELEIQTKITSAALQLANRTSRKSLRKKRLQSYNQAQAKLREIEKKLSSLKVANGLTEERNNHHVNSASEDDASIASSCYRSDLSGLRLSSSSAPSSPSKQRSVVAELRVPLAPGAPCRQSEYDNISSSSGSVFSLQPPYKNRFESSLDIKNSNMYSVANRRTSQVFDDQRTVVDQSSSPEPDYNKSSYPSDLHQPNDGTFFNYRGYPTHSSTKSAQSVGSLMSRDRHPSLPRRPHRPEWRPSHSSENIQAYDCVDGLNPHSWMANSSPATLRKQVEPGGMISRLLASPEARSRSATLNPSLTKSRSTSICISAEMDSQQSDHPVPLSPHSLSSLKSDLSGSLLRFQAVNNNFAQQQQPALRPKKKEWLESSLDTPIAPVNKAPVQGMVPCINKAPQVAALPINIAPQDTMAPLKSPTIIGPNGKESTIVLLNGRFKAYEESKPYETADFYRYSTKHRQSQPETPDSSTVSRTDESGTDCDRSFSSLGSSNKSPQECRVAETFHNEMWAWYEDKEKAKQVTLV